jgi:hypothetical protein
LVEKPDIDTLMAGPLGAWLREQEVARETAKQKTKSRRFNGLLAAIPVFAIIWVFLPMDMDTKFWVSGAIVLAIFAWAEIPKRQAVRKVKIGINEALAGALGFAYEHDCEGSQAFSLCETHRLVPNYDRSSFEDRWSGMLGGLPFAVHEAKLEERRGSGKNRRWVTVFRGVIMQVGFDRKFHGTTVLVEDRAHSGFFGGRKDSVTLGGQQLEHVEMVHPEFEDAFDIYSNDQVEARYIVHPAYVERLIALEKAYQGEDIRTLFHQGDLVVALKARNMFESGSIEASDDRARIVQTIDQFARLAELAAVLNERSEVPPSA